MDGQLHVASRPGKQHADNQVSSPSTSCLNLGCGVRFDPSWVNVDLADLPGVMRCDLRDGIRCPDGSFGVVYHSRLLEHVPREQTPTFLMECNRILRPGGIIRVV